MARIELALACLLALTLAYLAQTAGAQSAHTPRAASAAKRHRHEPKHSKSKPKPATHCELGQARVQAGVSTATEPAQYTIDIGYGFPGRMKSTLINCKEPTSDGLEYDPDLGLAAVLSGDSIHNGASDLLKPSPDGTTFEGSATGLGSEPSERYSWSWSFKVTS
jgi:hypothetical protein